jgi:hypothetical protein
LNNLLNKSISHNNIHVNGKFVNSETLSDFIECVFEESDEYEIENTFLKIGDRYIPIKDVMIFVGTD